MRSLGSSHWTAWLRVLILRLPRELREMIFNEVVGDGTNHLKTWERACKIRLELMDERGKLKPEIDRETFSRTCKQFFIYYSQLRSLFAHRESLRALSDSVPEYCEDRWIDFSP